MRYEKRLVVVSNRVPPPAEVTADGRDRPAPVGGLISALKPAMEEHGGVWFGWSGRSTQRKPSQSPLMSSFGRVQLATVDLSEDDLALYYTGFANRTLWPLLHSFPQRVVIRPETYRAYRRINRRFAEALYPMLGKEDVVWVHDYHLVNFGQELRDLGWRGKIGFFLHVPFPSADIFAILPWANQLLEGVLSYDLVGVHTDRYLHNLIDTLSTQLGGTMSDGVFAHGDASARLGVYQIGIEPTVFQQSASRPTDGPARQLSLPTSSEHRIILGVDRLDYTKGIPERLRAFELLLHHHRSLRGKVSFVQISSPSRSRIPEYILEKENVDQLVGQINGRFAEGGWVPIHYLYRSYPHHELADFYRNADVCMVTPLRDGMNLVGKEFVASQLDDPGVLVLSKFSGAASTMGEALLVNPYDIDGTAEAVHKALQMSAPERRLRWEALIKVVCKDTARSWSNAFRSDLACT